MKKTILTGIAVIIILAAYVAWNIFGPTISAGENIFFYIRTGENFKGVKDSLIHKKIVTSSFWFNRVSKLAGFNESTVKAGKYKLQEGMSLLQLIRMLKNGRQTPVNLIITRLRTKEDFARKAGRLFECDSLQIIDFLNNPDSLSHYGLDTNTVMSAIIPDTYTYFWNTTPSKVFSKLYNYSQKFWTEERKQKAVAHGLSPIGVYTLASIIEEETNDKDDKGNIASVYINRMQKGMPLQADPTIKYAMKDFSLKRIYHKHLDVVSPYNTYRNKGLPPGPVCTPSKETIEEVLNAPQTEYLYFVAKSDLSGKSVFTTNYKDHLKFAREYQQTLNRLDSARKAKQTAQ